MTIISPVATSELPPLPTAAWVLVEPQKSPSMENHSRDESPSGLSDIAEGDGLLGIGLTVSLSFVSGIIPLNYPAG